MDIVIEALIIEDDRPAHIAKHDIKIDEVLEVVDSDYVCIPGKYDRLVLIGVTKAGRYLAVVIGERGKKYTYGLVTARPARKKEKHLFEELRSTQGGD